MVIDACEQLKSRLNSKRQEIEKAMKKINQMKNKARKVANSIVNDDTIDQYMDKIKNRISDQETPSKENLMGEMGRLLDCAYIQDSDTANQIAEAMDMLDNVGDTSELDDEARSHIDNVFNQAEEEMMLNEMQNTAHGSMDELERQFDNMKRGTLGKTLNEFDKLIECVEAACDDYEDARGELEGYKEQLGEDDEPLMSLETRKGNVDPAAKEKSDEAFKTIDEMKSFSLFGG